MQQPAAQPLTTELELQLQLCIIHKNCESLNLNVG
jgi:hypothetical protein